MGLSEEFDLAGAARRVAFNRLAVAAAAALAVALARPRARAEDALAYKFEQYSEEDGRISVATQSSAVDEDIGASTHLRLTGTTDAVAGATPTGRPAPDGSSNVVLTEIDTRRKAWSADVAEQLRNVNIDLGFAESRESDYVSYGWSLNTLTDFNEKNTTVRAGIAGTDDRVEVFFEPAYLPKHTTSGILGVTQVLTPLAFVTVNLSGGEEDGYLAEPHKTVEKSIEIFENIFLSEAFGENRPAGRQVHSVLGSFNQAVPAARAALETSYRFYWDSYGVRSGTAEVAWLQHLGRSLLVTPSVRFYEQGAASFYYYNLDATSITPSRVPTEASPYYSSDFRLSSFISTSVGLKATWAPRSWVQVDVGYERYAMRGRDGVTPGSAYPTAGISTVGIKYLW